MTHAESERREGRYATSVYLTDEEKEEIGVKAKEMEMSLSVYLRWAGKNMPLADWTPLAKR